MILTSPNNGYKSFNEDTTLYMLKHFFKILLSQSEVNSKLLNKYIKIEII